MSKNKNNSNEPEVRDGPMPQGVNVNLDGNDSYMTEVLSSVDGKGGDMDSDTPVGISPFTAMDDGNHGSSSDFKRTANFNKTASQQMSFSSNMPQMSRVPLMYVDPLFDPILMLFPVGDRAALNERLRHYYHHHPYVGNIIDLHAEFPLSDFSLETGDPSITKYYNGFKNRIGLLDLMVNMLKDYWLLGECFRYGNWDQANAEWSSFVPLIPESVDVHSIRLSNANLFFLEPDDEIREKAKSNDPVDRAIIENTDPDYVAAARRGNKFRLDNKRLLYMFRKGPGDQRGTSIMRRVLKDLVYEDKLRLLQYTFIDRHMFPIKIFKLGSEKLGWIPSEKHFQHFQNLLTQAANDPDFNILYHWGLKVDYVGTKDKIANLQPHFDFVEKRILAGLFANDNLVHGEAGNYASSATSAKILMNKYLTIRAQLERLIKYKVFLPIAKERGFVKRTQNELDNNIRFEKDDSQYILPKYVWEKLNLLANTTQQQMIIKLYQNGDIPFKYVSDLFGWDSEDINQALKSEKGTMLDPHYREERRNLESENSTDYLDGKDLDEMIEEKKKELREKEREEEKQPDDEMGLDKKKDDSFKDIKPDIGPATGPSTGENDFETPEPQGDGEPEGEI